jgi:hypothetical protein
MTKSPLAQNSQARQPFQPLATTGKDTHSDALLRIAHALEYIPGQLHEVQVSEHLIALSKSKSVYVPPD